MIHYENRPFFNSIMLHTTIIIEIDNLRFELFQIYLKLTKYKKLFIVNIF